MTKGFVFGKFLPFHKGHEAMIRFALNKCDLLTVLICCSNHETISDAVRRSWLESAFHDTLNVDVKVLNYQEEHLPNTSVASRDVSRKWSETFKSLFPDYDLLITSEPYGDYVAEYMGIRHVLYDKQRLTMPISATKIRANLFDNWHFLPESVQKYFFRKVVILGTESTGKTQLATRLAQHFGATLVPETARGIIASSKDLSEEALYAVAHEHAYRIQHAPLSKSPLLVVDTDVHITQSYAQTFLGQQLLLNPDVYAANKADLYLYLNPNVPFEQDGTRLDEAERNRLDAAHRAVLRAYGVSYHELFGTWDDRFALARDLIQLTLFGGSFGI